MLVINSIDKSRLSADSFSYSGNGVAWKAKLVLFLGFALMAGGLAGSVVCIGLAGRSILINADIAPHNRLSWFSNMLFLTIAFPPSGSASPTSLQMR